MALRKCKECGKEVSSQASACPQCGAILKKKTGCVTWIVAIVLVLGAIGALQTVLSPSSNKNPTPSLKEQIASKVTIEWSWHKGGFDSIMICDFKITNKSDYDVKDITVKCVHSAQSGTQIDSNTRTIFKVFPKGETLEVKDFNMGFIHSQAEASSVVINDFVIVK